MCLFTLCVCVCVCVCVWFTGVYRSDVEMETGQRNHGADGNAQERIQRGTVYIILLLVLF